MVRRKRKAKQTFDFEIGLAGGLRLAHMIGDRKKGVHESIVCHDKEGKTIAFIQSSAPEFKSIYSLMKGMQSGYESEMKIMEWAQERWPLEASYRVEPKGQPKASFQFVPELLRDAVNDALRRTEKISYMSNIGADLRNLTPENRAGIEGILKVLVTMADIGHRKYVSEMAAILSMCHETGLLSWEKPAEWTPEVIHTEIPHVGAALNTHIPKIATVFEALFERGILEGERPDVFSVNDMGVYSKMALEAIDNLGVADLAPIVAKALEVGLLHGEKPITYDRATVVACRDNLIVALDGLPAEREAKEELESRVEELEGKVESGENLVPLIKKGFEAGLLEGEEPETYDETNIPDYTKRLMTALGEVGEREEKLNQRIEQLEGKLSTKESRAAYVQARQAFEGDYSSREQALAKLDEAIDLGSGEAELAKSLYTEVVEIIREGEGGKAENTDALKALKSMQPEFNVKIEINLLATLEYAKLLAYRARKATDPAKRAKLYDNARGLLEKALSVEPNFKGAQLYLEEYTREEAGQTG